VGLAASTLDAMVPFPLAPGGSVRVGPGVGFLEDDEGAGSVFLWGMAAWCWGAGDGVARRLAAVQLVESKAARQRDVADAFGVNEDTVMLWRGAYRAEGTVGLAERRRGPKGPSKLTDAVRDEVGLLRSQGLTLAEVAGRCAVSTGTVRRALATATPAAVVEPAAVDAGLEPLAAPADRSAERQAARAGAISEAPPQICEGASLPLAGALIILPALAATGLLDAAGTVYATGRAAFYGLRSLVLAVVFAAMLGEPRAEGLTRLNPTDVGRLLGLDRAPEVNTMRRRMAELAGLGRADQLIDALARRHLNAHPEISGIFYVDGHVRAYHGSADVGKAHVARIRLAMRAEVDTWVCDRNGDGVLVWATPPGASLTGELRDTTTKIRTPRRTRRPPDDLFRPGRLVPETVRRTRPGRVRDPHLPQRPRPDRAHHRVHRPHLHRRLRTHAGLPAR
jgi:transposase-like protein